MYLEAKIPWGRAVNHWTGPCGSRSWDLASSSDIGTITKSIGQRRQSGMSVMSKSKVSHFNQNRIARSLHLAAKLLIGPTKSEQMLSAKWHLGTSKITINNVFHPITQTF